MARYHRKKQNKLQVLGRLIIPDSVFSVMGIQLIFGCRWHYEVEYMPQAAYNDTR